jgi:two-component system, NtrC family, sensor kinase
MGSAISRRAEGDPVRDARERGAPNLAEQLREAEAALLSRPRVSMRLRLVVSLALCFLLSCAFSLGAFSLLRTAKAKLLLLQTLERLDDRMLRVRALADEGTLAAADIDKVVESLGQAEPLLRSDSDALEANDRDAAPTLLVQLDTCRRLLSALRRGASGGGPAALPAGQAAELRRAEAEGGRLLEAVIRHERVSLDTTVRLAEAGPLVLLGLQLLLFVGIVAAFAKALVQPIRRFGEYTARIAAGDYSFIAPARGYRDEFSDLALAVNTMLGELQAQQDRLVKGAKLAAVGTLTSGIAHELNNPLNNVAITAETLMEELPTLSDDEKWHLLQDIYFENERASEIVRSLLDFTRQEPAEAGAVDLAEVIGSTLRLAQNEMNLNNVSFSCELPPDLPRVRGTANQLRQVLLNVLLNAIQAMPGGGRVWVSAGTPEAGRVCVEVRDEGEGIPPEVLPRIFDPFFTTKEPGRGTGLGLSVSLAIVRTFGGDLQVASEPGQGTTVHACLPRAEER